MKKTFNLASTDDKPARKMESVRHEIKKYIKRERRKQLPEGVDYWDFDCRFGSTAAEAEATHISDLTRHLTEAENLGLTSFYVEILVKEGRRRGGSQS